MSHQADRSSLPKDAQTVAARDERHMRRAIAAARGNPSHPFGAVLVDSRQDRVVVEGVNRGRENPLWHGEVDALNRFASTAAGPDDWSHLHLYTTAEPCCMCQAAILWAGVRRVVFGTSIPTLQRLGWHQIDLRAEDVIRRAPFADCELLGGVLEDECDTLFEHAHR